MPALDKLLVFRPCHPLYRAHLIDLHGHRRRDERVQLLESVLELPKPLLKYVRVPFDLTPGRLQTEKLDPELIAKGLITAKPPLVEGEEEEEEEFVPWDSARPCSPRRPGCSSMQYPEVSDFTTQAVWAAGEILRYGNFNTYVTTKDLTKQEGLIFRHLLRLILLTRGVRATHPPGVDRGGVEDGAEGDRRQAHRHLPGGGPDQHRRDDQEAHAADVVEGEEHAKACRNAPSAPEPPHRPTRGRRRSGRDIE